MGIGGKTRTNLVFISNLIGYDATAFEVGTCVVESRETPDDKTPY